MTHKLHCDICDSTDNVFTMEFYIGREMDASGNGYNYKASCRTDICNNCYAKFVNYVRKEQMKRADTNEKYLLEKLLSGKFMTFFKIVMGRDGGDIHDEEMRKSILKSREANHQ